MLIRRFTLLYSSPQTAPVLLSRYSLLAVTCLAVVFLLISCHSSPSPSHLQALRSHADSIVDEVDGEQSLDSLVNAAERKGDRMLEMRARKKLGRVYRESNFFIKAIDCHTRELKLAEQLGDTIAAVQALNNIGTNFRRMGILDEAVDYHYRGLHLCEEFSLKDDSTARKNRVISLNGIGNICLTLGDTETADSVFNAALEGEKRLGSHLGQAINYANLGSLYERNGQIDSAWTFYRRSMEQNRLAKSDLGISLCYTHFGRLNEKQGRRAEAIAEYRKAYEIMAPSDDRWHTMEPCLALAEIYIKMGDDATAMQYLDMADRLAHDLHSLEHHSQIARLYYDIYNRKGDTRQALHFYKIYNELGDSVSSEKNIIHMQNMRVRYEHEQHRAEMESVNQQYRTERTLKRLSFAAGMLVVILAAVIVCFMLYALRARKRKQEVQHQLDEMRLSFFTNITHEFRTPLTVILGYSRMMEEGKVPMGDITRVANMVSRQGSRLLSLINQLLDIQKVKSAVGMCDWYRGDVVLFLSNIIESHLNMAHSRGIRLLYAPKQQKAVCDFVPDYAQKVVCNLVTNAIKFSKEGSEVLVSLDVEDDMLQMRVADFGSGISQDDQQRIFEPFYQTESDKKNVGSGVGLALVKQIVSALNGSISLVSKVGEGSVFTVRIPVKAPEGVEVKSLESLGSVPTSILLNAENDVMPETDCSDSISEADDADDDNQSDTRQLVLIVEDNADVAEYMTMLLKTRYRLAIAHDGMKGLEMATQLVPDIIVTDVMMPRMDGYELCQAVKQSDVLNHIPVIIVTAKTTQADKLRGLQLGVDAYIYKPFDAEELAVSVGNLLEKSRMLRERYMQAVAEHQPNAEAALPPQDRAFIDRVNTIVDKEMNEGNVTVDTVAVALCMSSAQFRRKLTAVSGTTPAVYIRTRQMQMAQRILDSNADLPINEVAMKCGFYDVSHFTRTFKLVMGVTPTQYKKG
ncbi:ATP-binding protein [uncultured Prevotella sp.]|uniref:hybrid sensor histidine kinase/response regulator transcription factor n=1 Tax=uncultured Prevotella sp. TaxID=159272 RepID=UPI0027E32F23|nr:ATP-binding protein [uncultured Prevotella sp.]